jgi:hypothetical protein
MVSTLKIEDRLEGATNFRAWKARILLLLEENDLKEYVEMVVPSPNDPQELAAHKKKEVKAKRVLLDSVKDHLIPHISEKKTTKEMYELWWACTKAGMQTKVDFEAPTPIC